MGQKVNPIGLRVGVNRDWSSRWFANDKDYAKYLHQDIKIRKFLTTALKDAGLSHIDIERKKDVTTVLVHVSKPGVVLGQNGDKIKEITAKVIKLVNVDAKLLKIEVVEVKSPDLDASLVAQDIARQLEQRASFRTVQKKAMQRVMKAGAKGVKTKVSGRLGGADIARSEGYKDGVLSLHTIRQEIDYSVAEADTTYGKIGVKVWIAKGEKRPAKRENREEKKGE